MLSASKCHSTTGPFPLSLHDALPIYRIVSGGGRQHACPPCCRRQTVVAGATSVGGGRVAAELDPDGPADGHAHLGRSEEHTSELQSRFDLVCRLLPAKKTSLPSCHLR